MMRLKVFVRSKFHTVVVLLHVDVEYSFQWCMYTVTHIESDLIEL